MDIIHNNDIDNTQIITNTDTYTNKQKDLDTDFDIIPLNIFRYKFTQDFMNQLFHFSQIHQYDERNDFKDAWSEWLDNNNSIVRDEITRLNNLGYEGDILDKMYKSARYYFRKKNNCIIQPKTRRQYISIDKQLLDLMDTHILLNITNLDYQPKTDYILFYNNNLSFINQIIHNIQIQYNINDLQLIHNKIKKTFKNRYFIIINKHK